MTKRNPIPPGLDASPKNTNRTISLEGNVTTTSKPLTTVCANSITRETPNKLTVSVCDGKIITKSK